MACFFLATLNRYNYLLRWKIRVRSKPLEQVVIVGGGSAGWLTAALVAAAHQTSAGPALKVTPIESPDVAPVGVGEGTWPSMRDTLHRIGVSENDFFRACDASFGRFLRRHSQ